MTEHLPLCAAPGCTLPRMVARHRRHTPRFCPKHQREAQEHARLDAQERTLTSCTLTHLWQRWSSHPYAAAGRIDGRAVWGMKPEGKHGYRVTLQGAQESVVMRESVVVELGKGAEPSEAKNARSPHSVTYVQPRTTAYQTTCKQCGAERDANTDLALCHEHFLEYRRERRRQKTRNKQAQS